jgi:hypothetical protein
VSFLTEAPAARTSAARTEGEPGTSAKALVAVLIRFEHVPDPEKCLKAGQAYVRWKTAMTRLVFRTLLAAILNVPFAATSFNEAPAQQRATCSQARSQCGVGHACRTAYRITV